MKEVGGWMRMSSGLWVNMGLSEVMRVWCEAGRGVWRVEVKVGREEWLYEGEWSSEEEACRELDGFMEGRGVGRCGI